MNTHSFVLVSLFASATCALTGCGFFSASKAASAAEPPVEPSSSSEPAAPAASASESVSAPEPREEAPKKSRLVRLDAYGLPLSIEVSDEKPDVSAWKIDSSGGAAVGSHFTDVTVHVYKADAKLQTLAKAKITRKKMSGCDAYPLIKEEADHLVFDCKMRSMNTLQFLMLREIGGVTYVCESEGHADTVADLDVDLAACRTLKPL